MPKIEKLTPAQEKQLPIFRQEYLNMACDGKRIDKPALQDAINQAYSVIGKSKPLLIVLQSPQQAMLAIKFMKTYAAEETGDQLGGQLWDQLRGQLWGQDIFDTNLLCGSQDLYWVCCARYAQSIGVKLSAETDRRLDIMEGLSRQCEWWWPYEGICFVSEKPMQVNWDGEVLHSETGPAVLYEDGYAVYSWRGTGIPSEWIESPKSLTPEMAITWDNVEQRRCIAEILGWHNILIDPRLNARSINKDQDPQIGELIEVDIPDVGTERFLKVVCGTDRDFALPVPPETKTALDAQAWLNFCTTEDILKLEVRT